MVKVTVVPEFSEFSRRRLAMAVLQSEGNQLFVDGLEVREYGGTHCNSVPAHDRKIRCVGSSAKGTRIITMDEGGRIKIWDPSRSELEKRVWYGSLNMEVTAIGVTEDGKRIAVAVGLVVTIYDVQGHSALISLEQVPTPKLSERITNLHFSDNDHVVCHDGSGHKCTVARNPCWQVR
ncbi:MAG: WD40 repeat domain-containing protein [bacterium]|nr:WD40 repeat domain-containing protein [bacterium]